MKAREALLAQLKADGIGVIFGNPGSTEQTLLESIGADPDITYVLGLQEASVAAMADGWARVTRKPAFCQLHAAVGLGNAIGVMYEAFRAHTPIVFVAGEPPHELQSFDGFLAGDLTRIAEPVTKWSARVTHGRQLPRLLRRAIKVAATPPYGPVFLALPMDALDEEVSAEDIRPTSLVTPPHACSAEASEQIAHALLSASDPVLLVGDGVLEAGARDELERLADLLAIPVWGVEFNELSMGWRHPMFMGLMGHTSGQDTRARLLSADVVVGVGTPLFPELFPSTEPYLRDDALHIHIDRDPWEISKNVTATIGLQADPKSSIARIIEAIAARGGLDHEAIEARRNRVAEAKRLDVEAMVEALAAVVDHADRLAPSTMMRVLARSLPNDAIVYDESLTSTPALLYHLQPNDPDSYVLARGGCIGVGWPGAIGAAVARPNRRIVAPSGDGSAMYALAALWTAANLKLKVTFVVCNNATYRILKINLLRYQQANAQAPGNFPYMDISPPRTDFTKFAEAFGIPSATVNTAEELAQALRKSFATDGPMLIDVAIDGSVDYEIAQRFPQSTPADPL